MTLASFILGILIASIPACLFNFFVAGNLRKLAILNIFAWIGFFAGQLVADWRGWTFFKVGPIILGIDLPFAILFIVLGYWLTNFQTENKKHA